MKRTLFITLVGLISSGTFAQNTFDKVIRNQNQVGVLANSTHLNSSGELFISGNIGSNQSHISKLDNLGNPIWTKIYDKSDNIELFSPLEQSENIQLLQDSNYLLTRTVRDYSAGIYLTYLIKFSENGNLIWSYRVHKNNQSNTRKVFTIEMDNGKILHLNAVDQSNEIDIIRLNAAGIVENSTTYGNMGTLNPIGLVRDSNSAYVISNTAAQVCVITHLDSLGNFIDAKSIPTYATGNAVYLNGKIHLIGYKNGNVPTLASIEYSTGATEFQNWDTDEGKLKGINNTLYSYKNNLNHGTIYTLNLSNQKRSSYYHNAGTVDMHEIDSTHLYFIGTGPVFGLKKAFGEPQIGLNLFEIDNSNSNCLSGPTPQLQDSIVFDTISTTTFSIAPSTLMILDTLTLSWTNGTLTSETGCVDFLGELDEQSLANRIQFSPNPANDVLNIKTDELTITNIEARSVNGQRIKMNWEKNGYQELNTEALPNGIYFLRLTVDNGSSVSKKLIIQH